MTDAVTLIIKGCQGEPGELVAEAAFGDAASRHGGQRHEALVRLPRPLSSHGLAVQGLPVLGVHRRLLLDLVHEGGYESVHLNCLTRKHLGLKTNLNLQIRISRVSVSGIYLEYLRNPSSILYNTKLNEQARQTVFIVLLTRLGVIPRELLKLEPEQDNLTLDIRQHEGKK